VSEDADTAILIIYEIFNYPATTGEGLSSEKLVSNIALAARFPVIVAPSILSI
jgi:hypothetical protein